MEDLFYLSGAWVLFVFAQSMFLNGIKIAASGTTETMPNGLKRDSNMILYPIAKWLDTHYIQKAYYQGEELTKLYNQIVKDFGKIIPVSYRANTYGISVSSGDDLELLIGIAKEISKRVGGVKYDVNGRSVSFYKEYKKYRFSKWVRLPTLGCIRCMSSYWSLVTYWLPMMFIFNFDWWMIPLWLANIPSVTFVNTYIAQRYNEN